MNPAPTMNNTLKNNIGHHPSNPGDLRGRVVEILSGTANGCLTELGYHPGMPQKLLELERTNAQWQQENVKLFQDNRSLARALQAQNERLKLISGPEIPRMNAMRTLERENQVLSEEKSHLLKQNKSLMANQNYSVEYGRLYAEYSKLSTSYQEALNEINRLRNYIQVLSSGSFAQPSTMVQPTPNIILDQPPPSRQSTEVTRIAQNQSMPQIRRPSADYPSSHPVDHSQTILSSLVPTYKARPPIHVHRPISAPSSIPPNQQYNHHPPLSIQTSHFVVPSHPSIPHLPPTPMSAINPPQISNPSKNSSPVSAFLPPNPTIIQMNGNVITSPGTSSPRDQTPSQITPDKIPPGPVLTRLPTPCKTPFDPLPNSPEVSTSPAATAPTHHIDNLSQSPKVTAVSSPRPEITKRRSVDMSSPEESENQQPKKQKLDDHDTTIEQVAAPSISSDRNETARVDGMDVDQESDDESVEIGPDGLRSEEDCLAALMDDDDEDNTRQTCVLCKARYDMKYTADPPKVFVRATKEELVLHCSTEHHDAWETLRRNV